MKISGVCNGTLTIQANVNKKGDYDLARKVAEQMVTDSNGEFVIGSECEYEQWVQICAAWEHKQADDLKHAYKEAKCKVGRKTVGASKVLQLMDSEEDGESRYAEFVKLVAGELGIPTNQLDKELEPFI